MSKQFAYLQMKQDLKEKINSGQYHPGECIPSERDLCVEYDVSRATVRQAINELYYEGLIYKVQGKGTFVSLRKIVQPLEKLSGFSDDMKARGMSPGADVMKLELIQARQIIAANLQINMGQEVVMIKRLRKANNEPMAIETSYLLASKCSFLLSENLADQSLYHLLYAKGNITLKHARQSIEGTFITGENAKQLNVLQNSVGLLITRQSFASDNNPIEYVESVYRGDKYKFFIDLNFES